MKASGPRQNRNGRPDPVDVEVGRRLRVLRTIRRLSLSEVGTAVGLTYQQIQKYETGANRISASGLFRLARLLDVHMAVFFDGLRGQGPDLRAIASCAAFIRIDEPVRRALTGLVESLSGSQAFDQSRGDSDGDPC